MRNINFGGRLSSYQLALKIELKLWYEMLGTKRLILLKNRHVLNKGYDRSLHKNSGLFFSKIEDIISICILIDRHIWLIELICELVYNLQLNFLLEYRSQNLKAVNGSLVLIHNWKNMERNTYKTQSVHSKNVFHTASVERWNAHISHISRFSHTHKKITNISV